MHLQIDHHPLLWYKNINIGFSSCNSLFLTGWSMTAEGPVRVDIEPYLERIFLGLRNISHISSIYSKYLQKHFDITSSQLLFLRALDKEDGLSAGEIGRRIFIKPGTITGIVDRLEKKELVVRNRQTKDRRVINVHITENGRRLVRIAPAPIQSRLAINLRNLPTEDLTMLTDNLDRLIRLMQADEVTSQLSTEDSKEHIF